MARERTNGEGSGKGQLGVGSRWRTASRKQRRRPGGKPEDMRSSKNEHKGKRKRKRERRRERRQGGRESARAKTHTQDDKKHPTDEGPE